MDMLQVAIMRARSNRAVIRKPKETPKYDLRPIVDYTPRPIREARDSLEFEVMIALPTFRRIKVADIQAAVCEYYEISQNDLLSRRVGLGVVRPRQVAMYLAQVLTPLSTPQIGRLFDGRDHTTVISNVRKIKWLVARDALLAAQVADLQARLTPPANEPTVHNFLP